MILLFEAANQIQAELKFRMFFTKEYEVIDLYHEEKGGNITHYQSISEIGENLVSFCTAAEEMNQLITRFLDDLFDIEDDKAPELVDSLIRPLYESLKKASNKNPYFMYLVAEINNQIVKKELQGISYDAALILKSLKQLLSSIKKFAKLAESCIIDFDVPYDQMNPAALKYIKETQRLHTKLNGIVCEMVRRNYVFQFVDETIVMEYLGDSAPFYDFEMVQVLYPTSFIDVVNFI